MTHKILIVDDASSSQLRLRSLLEKQNYSVEVAHSYEQALVLLGKLDIQLLLLDVFMPEVDGFEACVRLRSQAQWKSLPIIFITASEDQQVVSRCFKVGGSDYVGKFAPPAELLARISIQIRLSETLKVEKEQQDLLHSGLNALPDDILIVSAAGEIIFSNQRAQQLVKSMESLIPNNISNLVEKMAAFFALDEQHFARFLELRHPFRLIVNSHQRLRRVTVSPIIDGSRHILLIASRDITEESRMQRHLRNAQKMTALSQIAGGLAHDLNNVLGGTLTYLSILKMHADERGRSIVSNLETASQRAADLVGQLLEFSRLDDDEQQVFSLNEMLQRCDVLLQRVGGEELCAVSVEIEANDLSLHLSRLLFQHALVNIAQKLYQPGEGLVLRCNRISKGQDLPLSLQAIIDENWCVVSLYRPDYDGFKLDRSVAAGDNICGLSLTIAHSIVEDAGGLLFLEGEPQLPLAAHIYLPLHQCEEKSQIGQKSRRVLVCESDRLQRQLLCDVIDMLEYESFDSKGLTELVQQERGLVAIIDCDLLLSDEALQQLKGFQEMSIIIAASSNAGKWMNVAAENSWQFLTKPYRIAEIQKILAAYEEN